MSAITFSSQFHHNGIDLLASSFWQNAFYQIVMKMSWLCRSDFTAKICQFTFSQQSDQNVVTMWEDQKYINHIFITFLWQLDSN